MSSRTKSLTQPHLVALALRHKKQAIILASACVLIVASWFGYQQYRLYETKQASILFSEFVDKREGDRVLANQLINSNTAYAPLAALLQARVSFNQGKVDESKALLLFVKNNAQETLLRDIAIAYLAQAQWQLGDVDATLALLDELPSYLNYYKSSTKGDIYASQQDKKRATLFYRQAIDFAKEHNINAESVELRLSIL